MGHLQFKQTGLAPPQFGKDVTAQSLSPTSCFCFHFLNTYLQSMNAVLLLIAIENR